MTPPPTMKKAANTPRRRRKVEDGSVSSSTTIKSRGVSEHQTRPLNEPRTFAEEPAYVSVGQKVTICPAPYEPVQCSITITIPCEATPTAIEKAKEWASAKVDQYLQEELTKATTA